MYLHRATITSLVVLLTPAPATAQFGAGFEAQVYPAGTIFALRGELELDGNDLLLAYLGGNYTDRRDWGKHDDEDGFGPGLGVGWQHFLGESLSGWHFRARTDLWFLKIDWDDRGRSGTSDVVVLQPTAVGGYSWLLGDGWSLDLNLAVGAEINVSTEGEDVGSGAIALVGAGTSFRF